MDASKRQFLGNLLIFLWWSILSHGLQSNSALTDTIQCYGPDGKVENGFKDCFKCISTNETIFSKNVCDGNIHCSDFSDECLCSRQTIPIEICNILYDPSTTLLSNCGSNKNFYHCQNAICRSKIELCGGNIKCLDFIKNERFCDEDLEENNAFRTITCDKSYKNGSTHATNATLCDGNIECDGREDECNAQCFGTSGSALPIYCGKDFSCMPGSWICDGEWDSPNLDSCDGDKIDEEELNCEDRYYCTSNVKISIPNSKVCNYMVDCDDGSDESIDKNCTDSRYYCHDVEYLATNNLSQIETLFIESSQLFDGKKDCPDGRDECNIGPLSFHSPTEMIASPGLRWMVWISGAMAFLGNIAVVCFTLRTVVKKRKSLNPISCGHHTLLFNLALADFLMSIYLLGVAIRSVTFTGDYCEEDLQWRSSVTCSTLGVISMISSEMSVMVMLTMSVFRFVTIFKPLLTFASKETDFTVKIVVLMAWAIAITISILPLIDVLRLKFASEVALHCHVFDSHVVKVTTVEATVSRYLSLMQKTSNVSLTFPTTISEMNEILLSICPGDTPPLWFGFYEQNSVCMPRIFATPSDPVWEVSIALITYNIVAFFVLFIFYVLIIRTTIKQSKHLGRNSAIPKCKLQARVTRLLLSDFACWIPICIIGFLYASGSTISPNLYAACGIVLLPINSALNPFLYSSYCDKLIETVMGLCGWKKPHLSKKACTMLTKLPTETDSQDRNLKKVNTEFSDLMDRSIAVNLRMETDSIDK